jgi:hypothetical protein
MNEKLNLVEILKNVQKGTKLWSPVCGDCEFVEIDEDAILPIICFVLEGGCHWGFREDGSLTIYKSAECVLFPSKENRDWSTFKVPKKHKHFEPFQKVLVNTRTPANNIEWYAGIYSHYDELQECHCTTQNFYVLDADILPYEGNEDKVGKIAE